MHARACVCVFFTSFIQAINIIYVYMCGGFSATRHKLASALVNIGDWCIIHYDAIYTKHEIYMCAILQLRNKFVP